MRDYFKAALATAIPGAITIKQVLNGGSIVLAIIGGVLTVLAGRWALRTHRIKFETAAIEKDTAALINQRERDRGRQIVEDHLRQSNPPRSA